MSLRRNLWDWLKSSEIHPNFKYTQSPWFTILLPNSTLIDVKILQQIFSHIVLIKITLKKVKLPHSHTKWSTNQCPFVLRILLCSAVVHQLVEHEWLASSDDDQRWAWQVSGMGLEPLGFLGRLAGLASPGSLSVPCSDDTKVSQVTSTPALVKWRVGEALSTHGLTRAGRATRKTLKSQDSNERRQTSLIPFLWHCRTDVFQRDSAALGRSGPQVFPDG